MKYRDHRGGLAESMKTVREIETIEDIRTHLDFLFFEFSEEVEEIKVKHVGLDHRNGWDTYYVLFRLKGEDIFYVGGMSDGRPKKKAPPIV